MKMKLVLIALGLFMFVGCKSKKMTAVDQTTPDRPLIEKETEITVDVDHSTGIMSLEEKFSFTRPEDKSMHDEKEFFVIIGSFRRKDNAERFQETLRTKGFNPVMLLSETGLHRISVDSFNIESEARERILQIRSRYTEHADTWLLIKKK
jgi:cell division protein FtsN